jgi:hypothetical protein
MLPLRSIAFVVPAVLALDPARAGQDLAALVPEPPALWIELPDMDRATEEVAATSLGRLWSALSSDIDPAEIAMHLELPEAMLEHGASGGVRGLLLGVALDLGLSGERAERWAESLGGALTLARWERPQGAPALSGLAFAASLRQGASSVLAGEVLDALEDESGPWGGQVELLELARGETETRAVWGWEAGGDLPAGYLVVRPGLIACTFERGIAERLAAEERSEEEPHASRQRFEAAREASRERGELVWLRLAGSELERAGSDPQAHAWLAALGLEGLASLELGITTGEGQIHSRLRIEPRERHEREGDGERTPPSWSTLEVLPSDTLAVMGIARSPRAIAQGLGDLAGALGDKAATGSILAKLDATPLFGRLGERGALADETLLFARSSGPGIPQFYAAIPSTPALEKAFGSLPGDGEREFSLGHGLLLRQRRLVEGEAWVFFRGAPDAPRSFLSLTREGNTWIGSDVSAQLQSLLRQRSRERLAVREESLRGVRNAIAAGVARAGRSQQDLIAFLHVRSSALVELVWPYAQVGLEWSGAIEDLESLPDPQEIARMVGDTTIVVLDLGDALELHGRGLLGGLAFLL